jgi:hypothetical protein
VDVEMPGDRTHVKESEDEQDQGQQADDGQREDQEQSEPMRRRSPLPVATPPRFLEHRKRLGCHPNPDLTLGARESPRGRLSTRGTSGVTGGSDRQHVGTLVERVADVALDPVPANLLVV